jgi:hypothetical protein
MSDTFLANLPRFDLIKTPPTAKQRRLLLGQLTDEDMDAELPVRAPVHAHPASENVAIQHPPPVARVPEFAELEIMLTALSDTIDRVEREARAHAVEATLAMASKLFPELSRRFLAEEIGAHLPGMVPVSAPSVEIRAPAALAERLRNVVGGMTTLSERCAVVSVNSEEDTRVNISWETGGLTFDFDGLLTACLAHLDSPQATIEE